MPAGVVLPLEKGVSNGQEISFPQTTLPAKRAAPGTLCEGPVPKVQWVIGTGKRSCGPDHISCIDALYTATINVATLHNRKAA